MKNYSLLLLSTLALCSVRAQEEIDFQVGYLPNMVYTITQLQHSENTIKYTGSEEFLERLKSNEIENPTITKDTTILKSISKTGELHEAQFPIVMELLESNNPTLRSGTKFFGKSVEGQIKIDSIYSESLNKEFRQSLRQSMESIINQIRYPLRKVRVGESFDKKTPFSLPIADVTLEMEINSMYTLRKVENGIGYFDLEQLYTIKSPSEEYDIQMEGKGKGKINYDIEKRFYTKFYIEMDMNVKTDMEAFGMEFQIKSTTDQSTKIRRSEGINE